MMDVTRQIQSAVTLADIIIWPMLKSAAVIGAFLLVIIVWGCCIQHRHGR